MLRNMLFGLTALAGCLVAGPATAADFDKYVPEDAKFYSHVNVPKLFASEMVRKAVPMAFDKYSDQIVEFAMQGVGMAKGMGQAIPDVGEDQMKGFLKMAADPKVIAGIFDKAGPFVTDIVIVGSGPGEEPKMSVIIKSPMIKAEEFAAGMAMVGAIPNMPMKFETLKKAKGTVYAMEMQGAPFAIYYSVPEAGVLHICMDEERAEKSFEAASKPVGKLAELMAKRNKDDFIFFAGLGREEDEFTTMFGNFTLDKNLSGKINRSFKEEAQAKDEAQRFTDHFGRLLESVKELLGEKAEVLKEHLEKAKPTIEGKTMNSIISIPGNVFEKILAKD